VYRFIDTADLHCSQALALGPVHLSALTRFAGLGVQVHWTIIIFENGRFGWTLDCTGSGSRDQCT